VLTRDEEEGHDIARRLERLLSLQSAGQYVVRAACTRVTSFYTVKGQRINGSRAYPIIDRMPRVRPAATQDRRAAKWDGKVQTLRFGSLSKQAE